MEYLGIKDTELKKRGGYDTAKEIASQPEMWRKTYERVKEEKESLASFLRQALASPEVCIILTGAGTSAFIGETLAGIYQKSLKVSTKSIATTDIITHPGDYFIRTKPTLLISFARSGDSPESLATVNAANANCDNLYQLIITCNRNGNLALQSHKPNTYVFFLPEETNDKSLAMTSSYTSMLLTGLLLPKLQQIEDLDPVVNKVIESGKQLISKNLEQFKSIASLNFERAVFLGSGPLFGVAHESHLKVQELSDGKVICKFDSFLGFRHGPRAVVNDSTLITYLFSSDACVEKYEIDLIRSIRESPTRAKCVLVGNALDYPEISLDYKINFPEFTKEVPEDFQVILYILPAQIIGFFKSLNLGLEPDSPSKYGSISRVVQGVTIY